MLRKRGIYYGVVALLINVIAFGYMEHRFTLETAKAVAVPKHMLQLVQTDLDSAMKRLDSVTKRTQEIEARAVGLRGELEAEKSEAVVAAVAAARVEAEEQAALRIKQVMRNASVQRRKDHTIGLKQKGLAANSTLSTELATAVARYAKQPQQDIPHKMHQTWRGHNHSTPLPDWVKSSVRNWKNTNPGYSHTMHDDGDIERRVRSLHPELIPAFEQMKPIQKADLFRYMVLYDEGGYYADCDVDCMQPIDSWISQYASRDFFNVGFVAGFEIVTGHKAVEQHNFAREFQLVQWTMGAVPGHPIIGEVLRLIRDYFEAGRHLKGTKSIIKSTGPGIWSDAIANYLRETYGVRLGLNESHSEDNTEAAMPYTHHQMHEYGAHIGDVMLFPTRAFALGSGGTSLGGHRSSDQLVRHNFKGTWKKGYVDHDPPDMDQSGADDHSHPGGHAASIDEAFNVTTTAGVDEVANTSTTTAGVYETANASSTFRTGH